MDLKEKEVADIRNRLHNLDLSDPEDLARYKHWRHVFIADAEGVKPVAYLDTEGNMTVGIGFNMDRGNQARKEWHDAFKHHPKPPDFDAVRAQKKRLTKAQIDTLYEESIRVREVDLTQSSQYGTIWHKLRANERLAIECPYYNGPRTVKNGSRFHDFMHKYYDTGDERYLEYAILEIEKYSNPKRDKGLANRRREEGRMLRSMECPLYSKPGEPLCPKRPLTVKEGEAVLPRGVDTWQRPSSAQDEQYYIWRTQGDERVRPLCRSHANRVFSWTNPTIAFKPGEAKYCRCTAEPVPHVVTVVPNRVTSVKKGEKRVYTYTEDDFWALWRSLMRLREQTERLLHDREQHHAA